MKINNLDEAAECFDSIFRRGGKDSKYLYACILDAQETGNEKQARDGLKRVLESYDSWALNGVKLAALIRFVSFDYSLLPNYLPEKDVRFDLNWMTRILHQKPS